MYTISATTTSTFIITPSSYDTSTINWEDNSSYTDTRTITNPCEHCINNPKNNPYVSGICNCMLPSMYNIRY